MIKRRFFKVDHDDNDGGSDSSSSESELELQPEVAGESEGDGDDDDDVGEAEAKVDPESPSSSSGYESEDSSVNEVGADSSVNEEDDESGTRLPLINDSQLSSKGREDNTEPKGETLDEKDPIPADALEYILCSKSVYKCRICPRVVCLKEETLKTHLKSKKHARSEKLLKEGRLKAMLNSDGEIEHQETAAEMHARVVAMAQNVGKRKNKGRQRQRSRKKKTADDSNLGNARQSTKSPAKKQRRK
ncbi:hypothetical protein BT93_F3371 [Corymbia citriodora subsp. variegata]|nr:hypothetical protein BT93_F3371 [Corymbia citriodora subsp. variegata]